MVYRSPNGVKGKALRWWTLAAKILRSFRPMSRVSNFFADTHRGGCSYEYEPQIGTGRAQPFEIQGMDGLRHRIALFCRGIAPYRPSDTREPGASRQQSRLRVD